MTAGPRLSDAPDGRACHVTTLISAANPGAEQLAVGEPFLVFRLVEFHEGQSLIGLLQPHFQRRFGPLAVTDSLQPYQDGAGWLSG
jgi:hypothetical protein